MDELADKISEAVGMKIVLNTPYKLCDYKPMYGEALKAYLSGYDFWGHCDMDLIWGQLNRFITDDVLDNYDMIGVYGHLIMYRNNEEMNTLFKKNGGQFSYKQVCLYADNFSFDEMSGMDLIAASNGVKQYKRLQIANMSPDYSRFTMANGKKQKEMFLWKNGRVLQITDNGGLQCTEYAYIHFSGKRPQNFTTKQGIDNLNLYLLAEGIMDRVYDEPTFEELSMYNRYINEETDFREKKQARKNKVKLILRKSLRQKVIWLKVHAGIKKFHHINGEK